MYTSEGCGKANEESEVACLLSYKSAASSYKAVRGSNNPKIWRTYFMDALRHLSSTVRSFEWWPCLESAISTDDGQGAVRPLQAAAEVSHGDGVRPVCHVLPGQECPEPIRYTHCHCQMQNKTFIRLPCERCPRSSRRRTRAGWWACRPGGSRGPRRDPAVPRRRRSRVG